MSVHWFIENKKTSKQETVSYVSGGKFGDFIQQLSIIYERFLLDKRPAVLYISNRGDHFTYGVKKAYKDLFPIVSKQHYIKEFKIHQGEPFDVDLSSWRHRITNGVDFIDNYILWMKYEYNIDWGKHKWILDIPKCPFWEDTIIVNTTNNRFPDNIDWHAFPRQKLVFIGFNKDGYNYFVKNVFSIHFHQVQTLYEMCIILNSCKIFIGSLSAPLSLAFGLHSPFKIGFQKNHYEYGLFRCIQDNIPSVVR